MKSLLYKESSDFSWKERHRSISQFQRRKVMFRELGVVLS